MPVNRPVGFFDSNTTSIAALDAVRERFGIPSSPGGGKAGGWCRPCDWYRGGSGAAGLFGCSIGKLWQGAKQGMVWNALLQAVNPG